MWTHTFTVAVSRSMCYPGKGNRCGQLRPFVVLSFLSELEYVWNCDSHLKTERFKQRRLQTDACLQTSWTSERYCLVQAGGFSLNKGIHCGFSFCFALFPCTFFFIENRFSSCNIVWARFSLPQLLPEPSHIPTHPNPQPFFLSLIRKQAGT